jgi:hypothetical protein
MRLKKDKKELIKKIVFLSYSSVFLKNEKPLSLILIAPPESSKTHFLLNFTTKNANLSTDLSYFGLINILLKQKNIKQIVIPDFLKITEKNQATKKNVISSLNAFVEEGLFDIDLAGKESIKLNGKTGGILTSTTQQSFYQNKKNWNEMGFKSRFIVVTWSYTNETMNEIMQTIAKEKKSKKIKPIKLNYKMTYIEKNEDFNDELIKMSEFSPRRLKNLTVLLKTIALVNNHKKPTKSDLEELKELSELMNLKFTPI